MTRAPAPTADPHGHGHGHEAAAAAHAHAVPGTAVATVAGAPVDVAEIDAREAALRGSDVAAALPAPGTSEGRQLRRWLTQLVVAEHVVRAAAADLGIGAAPPEHAAPPPGAAPPEHAAPPPGAAPTEHAAPPPGAAPTEHPVPTEDELLPDAVARLDIGSIPAAVLRDPLARAVFAHVTADVTVPPAAVEAYRARDPRPTGTTASAGPGWTRTPARATDTTDTTAVLVAAARRRSFALWLDQRRAALTTLAPGYEHPGDPRQPDNTHKH